LLKSKSRLWLVILAGMLLYFGWLFYKTAVDYNALLKEEKTYNEKIAYEEERKEALIELEKKAESDETIENLARNNLNYLRENEILFIDGEKSK